MPLRHRQVWPPKRLNKVLAARQLLSLISLAIFQPKIVRLEDQFRKVQEDIDQCLVF